MEDAAQWVFFWKIKVQRRYPRGMELCRAERLVLKLKLRAKTVRRAKCASSGARGAREDGRMERAEAGGCWLVI